MQTIKLLIAEKRAQIAQLEQDISSLGIAQALLTGNSIPGTKASTKGAKRRGRPAGSKNKKSAKRIGRPPGSKNKLAPQVVAHKVTKKRAAKKSSKKTQARSSGTKGTKAVA